MRKYLCRQVRASIPEVSWWSRACSIHRAGGAGNAGEGPIREGWSNSPRLICARRRSGLTPVRLHGWGASALVEDAQRTHTNAMNAMDRIVAPPGPIQECDDACTEAPLVLTIFWKQIIWGIQVALLVSPGTALSLRYTHHKIQQHQCEACKAYKGTSTRRGRANRPDAVVFAAGHRRRRLKNVILFKKRVGAPVGVASSFSSLKMPSQKSSH